MFEQNTYEARFEKFNHEYEFFQFMAKTNEEAINKAKKHALEYCKTLKYISIFNDDKFTLENIYTTN
jgi:hypothetical protein